MSTATNKLVRTLSEINPDDLPQFSSVEPLSSNATDATSGFFSNITWQTWLIVVLVLAFLGINIFNPYEEENLDFSMELSKEINNVIPKAIELALKHS